MWKTECSHPMAILCKTGSINQETSLEDEGGHQEVKLTKSINRSINQPINALTQGSTITCSEETSWECEGGHPEDVGRMKSRRPLSKHFHSLDQISSPRRQRL